MAFWTAVLPYLQLTTLVIHVLLPTQARVIPYQQKDAEYWHQSASDDLRAALERDTTPRVARNVILFIGDGMGMTTVTAARILKGQLQGHLGEDTKLEFEDFPSIALAKTYNVDHQVADSAGTATAFLCGVKANYGTVGLDAHAARGDCALSQGSRVRCILELAQDAGKSTGLVTTARVTHATPAPLYAASPNRAWEVDSKLPMEARRHGCADIGAQLLEPIGANINVVLGGGRRYLLPNTHQDPEYPKKNGSRHDGRNLIREWMEHKELYGLRAQYVWNQEQFDRVDPNNVDHLLGLFEDSHMHFDRFRSQIGAGEPDLAEMVSKAVQILDKNPNGFFLLVEGGRIDHAHHANHAGLALEETVAMDRAVRAALDSLPGGVSDTLIVVTADHSHALTISSYPKRGNPILGLTDYSDDIYMDGLSDVDFLPYTTLSYANGPGFASRANVTFSNVEALTYKQAATVPLKVGSHEGSDVPVYAAGPMSHLFHSTHEQSYIFHAMAYAACLGENKRNCGHYKIQNIINCGPGQICPEALSQSAAFVGAGQSQVLISPLALCLVLVLFIMNVNIRSPA